MLNFKCRIECTSVAQLNFNDNNIDTRVNYNNLLRILQPGNIDYIERIQIVYRKRIDTNYTLKSLEIFISKGLEEHQFTDLIRRMKDCGFRSYTQNNHIQFLDTSIIPMNILYDYNFRTEKPNRLIGQQLKTNRNIYNTKVLYKK